MVKRRKLMAEDRPPPKPQFFKILLPCFFRKLRIPEAFNKYIWVNKKLPRDATLLGPLRGSWVVEIYDDDDGFLYFGRGWPEFSLAHGLSIGYLLLFTYEAEMVFTVTIFDRTACVKEFISHEKRRKIGDSLRSNVMVVAQYFGHHPEKVDFHERPLGEVSSTRKSHPRFTNAASAPREGSQFVIDITSYDPCEEPNLVLPLQVVKYLNGDNGRLATIFTNMGKVWHVKIREDGDSFYFADGWKRFARYNNLRRGDSLVFKHGGDMLFHVSIFDNSIEGKSNIVVTDYRMPAAVEGGCSTELPKNRPAKRVASGMKHIRSTAAPDKAVKLEESAGRRDQCGCDESPDMMNESDLEKLQARWPKKMAPKTMKSPNVGKHEQIKIGKLASSDARGKTPIKEDDSNAGISRFEAVIDLSTQYRRYSLTIPSKFVSSNGLHGVRKMFLVDPDGHVWPLKVSHRPRRHAATAHAGWRDFCVGNNLRNGDKCSFELKGEAELHVRIRRRNQVKPKMVQSACTSCGAGIQERRTSSRRCVDEILGKSERRQRQVRRFISTVSASYLCTHRLNFPAQFLSSVDFTSTSKITLVDASSRRWAVKVNHWRAKNDHIRASIGSGWKEFCLANAVEVGHKCVFELTPRRGRSVLFRVSILKGRADMARRSLSS